MNPRSRDKFPRSIRPRSFIRLCHRVMVKKCGSEPLRIIGAGAVEGSCRSGRAPVELVIPDGSRSRFTSAIKPIGSAAWCRRRKV